MILIPWLFERRAKSSRDEGSPNEPRERPRVSRPHVHRPRRQPYLDEFPEYNPNHNDEIEWRDTIESKFRILPDYPPDWERRRALVFLRDQGRCQGKDHRGGSCGRLLCEPEQIWNFRYTVKLLVDAHVDHINSLSSGGSHALQNLQLLCARCHALKHPGNAKLDTMVLPRLIPRGRGRRKYIQKYFFTRKAPTPKDNDVPF